MAITLETKQTIRPTEVHGGCTGCRASETRSALKSGLLAGDKHRSQTNRVRCARPEEIQINFLVFEINSALLGVLPMMVARKQVLRIDAARPVQTTSLEDALQNNLNGLYRFALRLTENTAEAQDLVQETAARAWERQNTDVQNWRAWLFQTVYHEFISRRRLRQRWTEVGEDSWDEELEAGDPLAAVIATEDVRRAIKFLPDELRTVVWLSDAEQLRLREIAHVLGCPIGTVASRLWRARAELRKSLSAYGSPGEKQL